MSLNKLMLIGHLGKNPEITFLPSGGSVAKFSIATHSRWKDKSGQRQEHTEWHSVVLFGRLAEVAGEYLKKGSKVYLEGSLRTQKWQDKTTGQDRYKTEVIGSELQMLDNKDSERDTRAQRVEKEEPVDSFPDIPF